ncbi:hypothetical protein DAPPUDRAFT_114812 [Daphnia pulex]|uniref:Uncharacterized protein n=1 Tax=Daphnia pulex TaxID=6669 RepID=E9HJB3_DAPPU|nr:hypothetical protein DAPPUDRAFT_114812 [Daphnia pulex]|eukprot:EFX68173.1 hypothetical protein DAPPUDRAFT_114812 [Daphnia pulex]
MDVNLVLKQNREAILSGEGEVVSVSITSVSMEGDVGKRRVLYDAKTNTRIDYPVVTSKKTPSKPAVGGRGKGKILSLEAKNAPLISVMQKVQNFMEDKKETKWRRMPCVQVKYTETKRNTNICIRKGERCDKTVPTRWANVDGRGLKRALKLRTLTIFTKF